MAKQSQLQLQLTEVELGLQDGVDFDNSMLNLVFIQKLNFEETLEGSAEMMIFCCKVWLSAELKILFYYLHSDNIITSAA